MAERLKKPSKHSSLGAIPRCLCLRVCGRREITRKHELGDVYKRAHEDIQMHAGNFLLLFIYLFIGKYGCEQASQLDSGFLSLSFFANAGLDGIKTIYLCLCSFSQCPNRFT